MTPHVRCVPTWRLCALLALVLAAAVSAASVCCPRPHAQFPPCPRCNNAGIVGPGRPQAPHTAALETTAAASAAVQAGAAGANIQQQAAQVAAASAAQSAVAQQQVAATAASGGTVDDLFACPDKLNNGTIVEQLPQLKIEQVLDSSKPRSAQDVTLVTQLSFERLYMLEGQCDVWNGVISAAVYIALLNGKVVTVELNSNQDPRLTDIAEVEQKFKQFHQLAEAKGARGSRAPRGLASSARPPRPATRMQACASWTCSW